MSAVQVFENAMGKAEIARNEQFLLFPQCFLLVWRTFHHFHKIQTCRLQTPSVWTSLKFCCLLRGLNSLPDNISGLSNFKTTADNKIKVTQKSKFVSGKAKNILGKEKNASSLYFLKS